MTEHKTNKGGNRSFSCAGIILAGGLNSRMGGRNKAFLEIGGQKILDRLIGTISALFSECLVVTRDPEAYANWDVLAVRDVFDLRTPLTGIHAGLLNMESDYAFVTGCDAPFLNPGIIEVLLDAVSPESDDIIVPAEDTFFQPLCAVYSKRCRESIERQLSGGDPKVDHLFNSVNLKKVPYRRFKKIDPELRAFFNVNTPEELNTASRIILP